MVHLLVLVQPWSGLGPEVTLWTALIVDCFLILSACDPLLGLQSDCGTDTVVNRPDTAGVGHSRSQQTVLTAVDGGAAKCH